jgi:hypothetical protein
MPSGTMSNHSHASFSGVSRSLGKSNSCGNCGAAATNRHSAINPSAKPRFAGAGDENSPCSNSAAKIRTVLRLVGACHLSCIPACVQNADARRHP